MPQSYSAGAAVYALTWDHLTPFQQGYVAAALSGPIEYPDPAEGWGPSCAPRFDWLAGETLAAMLKDCERAQEWREANGHGQHYLDAGSPSAFWKSKGLDFWVERQLGHEPAFPPVALYLSDDGKIRQREAKAEGRQ